MFLRDICYSLLLITNWSGAKTMLIYIYDSMFSWNLKFWHQWWKTWKNDQIYRKRVVPSMCLQFHSHKKLGSKNTLKRERAYASLQLTVHTKVPSNELLTSDSHQSEDTHNFCTLVTFLTIITFIMFFFSEIKYIIIFILPLGSIISEAFVISSTTAMAVVTGTLLPFTSWVQWSHNLHTRYQEKTSLQITYIFFKTFSTDSFFSFSYLANVYILHSFGR